MRDYRETTAGLRGAAKGLREIDMPKTAEQMEDAADAIEELQAKNDKQTMMIRKQSERTKELLAAAPHWISVEELLPDRINPLHARDTYLVRLKSGCIKTLFYEYDNSDRCGPGMSPLFSEGWEKTASPVTHWMPLPEPPKEG